jgi:L-cystine uptake protein TcyP (sodium:dicarboxylate symporter family)
MSKLYQYDDIRKLNQALGSFARSNIKVIETKLLTVENKVQYFVLTDSIVDQEGPSKEDIKPVVIKSETEEIAKKEMKEKKEEKKETVEIKK